MRDNRKPRYPEVEHDWVYKTIQKRLGNDQMNPCSLHSYIEQVEYTIRNYINRNYIPEPLKFVVVTMTMDLLKSEALNGFIDNEALSDIGLGALSSIKDGDSEIKFKTSASSNTGTGAHMADVDSLIYNYKSQLDKYRLTKW